MDPDWSFTIKSANDIKPSPEIEKIQDDDVGQRGMNSPKVGRPERPPSSKSLKLLAPVLAEVQCLFT